MFGLISENLPLTKQTKQNNNNDDNNNDNNNNNDSHSKNTMDR